MLCYVYKDKIKLKLGIAILSLVGFMISCMLGVLNITVYFCLPYVLLYLAFGTKKKLSDFGKKAELSYGMYLFGCPLQQTVTMLFGGSMNPMLNFLIVLPIDIVLAYILYILVEKPVIKLMKKSEEKN